MFGHWSLFLILGEETRNIFMDSTFIEDRGPVGGTFLDIWTGKTNAVFSFFTYKQVFFTVANAVICKMIGVV